MNCPNCKEEILLENVCCEFYNDGNKIISMYDIEPKVGLGVTYCIGSDRYAYTIVEVVNPRTVIILSDESIAYHTTCFTEQQDWDHLRRERNGRGEKLITKRKNKRWKLKGDKLHDPGTYFLGVRDTYRDPSF